MSYQSLLFYRDFQGLTGGHLKVWDYYNHAKHSHCYRPAIYFSPTSTWQADNPWRAQRQQCLPDWQPQQYPVVFLEGMDWQTIPSQPAPQQPIINLIQHIRHANPDNPRYAFLPNRAIRICVSLEVTEVLKATQRVNGPIYTVVNGLDTSDFPTPAAERSTDVLIAGMKNAPFAKQLQQHIAQLFPHLNTKILIDSLPRQKFLQQLGEAKIAICLPMQAEGEGFFLPALEAMAMQALVICPDCVGNRSFCLSGHNCLRPQYNHSDILSALSLMLSFDQQQTQQICRNALQTLQQHRLENERQAFLNILHNTQQIW